jgi:hypothetical protein
LTMVMAIGFGVALPGPRAPGRLRLTTNGHHRATSASCSNRSGIHLPDPAVLIPCAICWGPCSRNASRCAGDRSGVPHGNHMLAIIPKATRVSAAAAGKRRTAVQMESLGSGIVAPTCFLIRRTAAAAETLAPRAKDAQTVRACQPARRA